MYWMYKCNNRRLAHQVAYGDWAEFFARGRASWWGSTEWVPQLANAVPGDVILAYQTDRNELVGLATVIRQRRRSHYQDLILRPEQEIHIEIRPLKRSNPAIARIPALQPGPIRTLYEVSDADALRLLRAAGVAARAIPTSGLTDDGVRRGAPRRGVTFGDPEENPAIEAAGIAAVKAAYKRRRWSVADRSRDCLGYDLVCQKAGREEHVEVKGTRGTEARFVLTENERACWADGRDYVLALVTSALGQPKITYFRGRNALGRFTLRPLKYVATLRS